MMVLRNLALAVFVAVMGFFAYQTHTEPQTRHNSLTHRLTYPTDIRVRYRIGEVDARFGLSHDEVKRLAHEAVMIWHEGTGSEWFVYDESAKLAINLIYDDRQIETNERQKIKQNIDELQHRHQANTDKLHDERQQLQRQFNQLQHELNAWQAKHDEVVHRLHHAQPHERPALIEQYNVLVGEQHRLNAQIKAYESAQTRFNQAVEQVNAHIHTLNQAVEHANTRFTPREFHKGEFRHGSDTVINIYEFENVDELRLVLAHELGHALYLDHNDDPTALMYPYAQEQDLQGFKLKQADIDLLNTRQFYK